MSLKSSIKSFLIKFLEEDKMTDQTAVSAAATTDQSVAATTTESAPVATTAVADTPASSEVNQEVAQTASENAPVVATTTVSTDNIKDAINATGKDVTGVWDKVVAFAKVADSDIVAGIKKALVFLEHEAKDVIDQAVELAKLK